MFGMAETNEAFRASIEDKALSGRQGSSLFCGQGR
jgi:hypothetical protein